MTGWRPEHGRLVDLRDRSSLWGCEMCIMPIKLFWYHCRRTWTLSVVRVAWVYHARRMGWYPSQDLSWGLPLAGGEGFIAVSCLVHSSDAFNQRSTIYKSPDTICVRSLSMLTCWDGEGRLLPSQTPIWFYLIVLNKRWQNTHFFAPPYGCRVGGMRWVDLR